MNGDEEGQCLLRREARKALGAELTDSGPEVLIFSWFCFVLFLYLPKVLPLKSLNIVPLHPAPSKKGVFVGEDQGLEAMMGGEGLADRRKGNRQGKEVVEHGSEVLPNILLPNNDPKRAYFCGCEEAETRRATWVGKNPLAGGGICPRRTSSHAAPVGRKKEGERGPRRMLTAVVYD